MSDPATSAPSPLSLPSPMITPDRLAEYIKVMAEGGCIDFGSGNTRIILNPVRVMEQSKEPLHPFDKQVEVKNQDETDEDLYASVT